ncbi:sigma-70 family RNA polymerase sigma factor [Brevibacillus sp. HB1.2]|uniref:sigma-70 family RNA polymerase sigma factor n=1 Tax=Brevibacillus sp. HB1.2 TaxID=2738807 RepID=UPI00037A0630|nr:sigma-70 family RNA polymerase sigma factor [Brevibacillus sp. HB1.2]
MSSIIAALSLVFKELLVFVAYVKNNAFPQPLQDTEEEKYLRLMAKGDPYARNKLIEHNLRLVAHIVKKFENTGEDSEDLISIGTIGLIKAIESYQVDKGTKLATYAARCIENEILKSKGCLVMKSYEKGDPYGPFKLLSSDLGIHRMLGHQSCFRFDISERRPHSCFMDEHLVRILHQQKAD